MYLHSYNMKRTKRAYKTSLSANLKTPLIYSCVPSDICIISPSEALIYYIPMSIIRKLVSKLREKTRLSYIRNYLEVCGNSSGAAELSGYRRSSQQCSAVRLLCRQPQTLYAVSTGLLHSMISRNYPTVCLRDCLNFANNNILLRRHSFELY